MSDRLFYAFWPDEAVRREITDRLAGWVGDYGGRPQRPDQWHLTVEFLGGVGRERQASLHELGAALSGVWPAPEALVLDRLEHWKKPQVLCITARETPPAVRGLVEALKAGLVERGFEPERRDFRPHLTLARKARGTLPARPVEPLLWPVHALTLVRSVTDPAGSRYEPLAGWNLVQGALTPTLSR